MCLQVFVVVSLGCMYCHLLYSVAAMQAAAHPQLIRVMCMCLIMRGCRPSAECLAAFEAGVLRWSQAQET